MKNKDLLTQLLGNPGVAGIAGGILGGLLTGKAGRKLGKHALQLGGAAAIAGLAYSAWKRQQASERDGPEPAVPAEVSLDELVARRFLPEPAREDAGEDLARALLTAMLAAARADGRLDAREREAIRARLDELELDARSRAALIAQLEGPVDLDALLATVKSRELAIEVYTASLLVIDADTPAERGHLMLLADRLGLPDDLVEAIHREVLARATRGALPAEVVA